MKRSLEFAEELFGLLGRKAMALQPFDQGMLKLDMPLALGDVIVHHLEVGRAVGHGFKITRTAVSVA